MSDRTTRSVLTHVEQERAMQRERWSDEHDSTHTITEWDTLILEYLMKPGPRYIRLVQVAALAVAAAEQEAASDD